MNRLLGDLARRALRSGYSRHAPRPVRDLFGAISDLLLVAVLAVFAVMAAIVLVFDI